METDQTATDCPQVDRPQERRSFGLRHLVGVAVATAMAMTLLAVPASVWAAGHFNDVPDDHPFFDDIEWMADNGISEGYDGGTLFKPNDAVTRQAMSAFMHRLSNSIEMVEISFSYNNVRSWTATASCPIGKRAISGGGAMSEVDAFITDSTPYSDAWSVRWESEGNILKNPSGTVWVTCMAGL